MESNKMVITRKIQLLIDSEDKEEVKKMKDQLYNWQWITYRSANMIMSHHFVQEQVKDFFYLTEDIKLKIADEKKRRKRHFKVLSPKHHLSVAFQPL